MLYDARVASRTALRQKVRLKLNAHSEYRLNQELTEFQRRYYTDLPEDYNPRTAESARLMRQQISDPKAFSNAVLSQFSLDGFVYTLKPGKLESRDSIDEFMFETKRGFCEHYASAYTFMMRAAGVQRGSLWVTKVVNTILRGTTLRYGNLTLMHGQKSGSKVRAGFGKIQRHLLL